MKSLALDTATNALTLALSEDDQAIASIQLNTGYQHGELLVPAIQQLMEQADWQPQDIDQVIVGVGPGSYTGLRIGVTLAKTWATQLKKQLLSVSSLALMAAAAIQGMVTEQDCQTTLIMPVIDARRGTTYTGLYHPCLNTARAGLLEARPDQHIEWSDWLDQLAPVFQEDSIQQVIFVGQDIEAFVQDFQDRFQEEDGLAIHTISGWQAMPNASFAHQVPQTLIDHATLLAPNYCHATLAEQEWAAKHQTTIANEAQNNAFIERTID